MARSPVAYVQWFEEEDSRPTAFGGTAPAAEPDGPARPRYRAAWLVCDVPDLMGTPQRRVLAYLGRRPMVTATLQEEIGALYPDVTVDWDAIRQTIDEQSGAAAIAALSDDELALRLRELARDRGLSLIDLSLVLGYRDRQVLPEVMALLSDGVRVARYERSAGSVFAYLEQKHPEYAYLLYKARLYLEGREQALATAIKGEPAGYSDDAWRARRAYWRALLDAYRRDRQRPDPA